MKPTSLFRHRGRGEGLNLGEVQKQAHFRREEEDAGRIVKREVKEEEAGEERGKLEFGEAR